MKRKEIFRLMFPAVAFAGMVLLASCSADELNSGGGSTVVPPTGETVSSGTVNFTNNTSMTIGNGSITEGTTRTAWMTRGASFDFDGNEACKLDMPAQPEMPAETFPLGGSMKSYSYDNGVVGNGRTARFEDITNEGATIDFTGTVYVDNGGTLEINQNCAGGGTIIVLEGGTVKCNIETMSGFNIYNYDGTVTFSGESITVAADANLSTTIDLDLGDKDLTVYGKLYVGGDLKCKSITSKPTTDDVASIHVLGALTTDEAVDFDGNVDVCVEGQMNVYKMIASNSANIHVDCKLVTNDYSTEDVGVNVTDGATLCASYVNTRRMSVSGGQTGRWTYIFLPGAGVIDVDYLNLGSNALVQPYNSGNALVDANRISIENRVSWEDVLDGSLYVNYETLEADADPTDMTRINKVSINEGNYDCSPGFTIDEPEDPDTPTGEDNIVIKLPTGITEDYTLKADDFAIRVNGEYIEDIKVDGNTANLGDIQITDDNLTIKVSGLSYDNIIAGNDYTYEVWLWVYNRKLLNDGTGGYGPLFDTPEMYEEWVNPDNDLYKDPYTEGMINYDPYGCDFTSLLTDDDVYSPAGYVVRYNTYRGLSGHVDKDTGYGDTPYIKVSIHVQRDDTAPEDTNVGIYPAIDHQ